MSDISTLLQEASGQAHNYADGRRAMATAQRNRRTRIVVTAALIAGLLAGGAALWQQREPELPAGPPARSHPLYPPVVTPSEQAPALPESPVGAAAFLYSSCSDTAACPQYLVLPDGTQYRLPDAGFIGHTLSPNGRYLGWAEGDRYRIRDLSAGTVTDIAVPGQGPQDAPVGWSPDSHFLITAREGLDNKSVTFARAAVDGSAPVVIPSPPSGEQILGILDSGEIVTLPDRQYPHPEYLRVLDAVSGNETRRIGLDQAGIAAAAGVTPGGVEILIAPCGCEVDFLLGHPIAEFGANTGLPQIDHAVLPMDPVLELGAIRADATGSGRILGRVDLPAPVLDRRHARFTSAWSIRADTAEGYVAVNWRLDGSDVILVDRTTGARNIVSRLPAGAVIMLRGNVYPR